MKKFTIPNDFRKVVNILNPDTFIADMFQLGEISQIKGDYSQDCKFLCNNAVAWILGRLSKTIYIYEIEVIEGYFDNWEHNWIKAGDYYLDLTLAQFEECPKIAISKIGDIEGYKPEKIYIPFEWAKKQTKECR